MKVNVTFRIDRILSMKRGKSSIRFANNRVFSFVLTASNKLMRKVMRNAMMT